VLNAIADALKIRVDEVPVTPEKILKALEERRKGRPARVGPTKVPSFPFPTPERVARPPQWELEAKPA
jgi:hypothetical protein